MYNNEQLTRILKSKPENLINAIQSNKQDLANLQTLLEERGKQVASLQYILSNQVAMVDKVINTKTKLQCFYQVIKDIVKEIDQLKYYVRKQVKNTYSQVIGQIAKCFKDLCFNKNDKDEQINQLKKEIALLNNQIKLKSQQIVHIDRDSSLENIRQCTIPMLETGGYTLGNQQLKELFSPLNNSLLSLSEIRSLKQNSYEGNFSKNQKQGKGEVCYEKDYSYKGAFKNGQRHGFGQLTLKGQTIYRGDWKRDTFWGKGTLQLKHVTTCFQNAYQYMGNFQNGQFNGLGVLEFDDGSRFTSQFHQGKVVSSGILKKNEYMSIMQYDHSISVDPICSK